MMRLAKSIATISSALVLALCFTAGTFAQTAPAQQPVQKPATKPAANAPAKPATGAVQSAPNAPAKSVSNPAAKTAAANTATKSVAGAAAKPAVSSATVSAANKTAALKTTASSVASAKPVVAAKPVAKSVAAKPVTAKSVALKPVMAKPIATKAVKTPAAPKTASTALKPAPKEAPAVGMTASPDQVPSASPDEPVGARRDPFVSLVNDRKESGGQVLPPGEAGLVVSTVRVDGTVKSGSDLIAVVSNPERHVYFIREGDHLYDGSVVRIDLDGVTFHEESKDAFGKPVVREVTKRIYATAGEQQ